MRRNVWLLALALVVLAACQQVTGFGDLGRKLQQHDTSPAAHDGLLNVSLPADNDTSTPNVLPNKQYMGVTAKTMFSLPGGMGFNGSLYASDINNTAARLQTTLRHVLRRAWLPYQTANVSLSIDSWVVRFKLNITKPLNTTAQLPDGSWPDLGAPTNGSMPAWCGRTGMQELANVRSACDPNSPLNISATCSFEAPSQPHVDRPWGTCATTPGRMYVLVWFPDTCSLEAMTAVLPEIVNAFAANNSDSMCSPSTPDMNIAMAVRSRYSFSVAPTQGIGTAQSLCQLVATQTPTALEDMVEGAMAWPRVTQASLEETTCDMDNPSGPAPSPSGSSSGVNVVGVVVGTVCGVCAVGVMLLGYQMYNKRVKTEEAAAKAAAEAAAGAGGGGAPGGGAGGQAGAAPGQQLLSDRDKEAETLNKSYKALQMAAILSGAAAPNDPPPKYSAAAARKARLKAARAAEQAAQSGQGLPQAGAGAGGGAGRSSFNSSFGSSVFSWASTGTGATGASAGTGLTVVTAGSSQMSSYQGGPMHAPPHGGNMQGGNMQGGNMQGGLMQGGNMQGGLMQGGNMQGGYMQGGYTQSGHMQMVGQPGQVPLVHAMAQGGQMQMAGQVGQLPAGFGVAHAAQASTQGGQMQMAGQAGQLPAGFGVAHAAQASAQGGQMQMAGQAGQLPAGFGVAHAHAAAPGQGGQMQMVAMQGPSSRMAAAQGMATAQSMAAAQSMAVAQGMAAASGGQQGQLPMQGPPGAYAPAAYGQPQFGGGGGIPPALLTSALPLGYAAGPGPLMMSVPDVTAAGPHPASALQLPLPPQHMLCMPGPLAAGAAASQASHAPLAFQGSLAPQASLTREPSISATTSKPVAARAPALAARDTSVARQKSGVGQTPALPKLQLPAAAPPAAAAGAPAATAAIAAAAATGVAGAAAAKAAVEEGAMVTYRHPQTVTTAGPALPPLASPRDAGAEAGAEAGTPTEAPSRGAAGAGPAAAGTASLAAAAAPPSARPQVLDLGGPGPPPLAAKAPGGGSSVVLDLGAVAGRQFKSNSDGSSSYSAHAPAGMAPSAGLRGAGAPPGAAPPRQPGHASDGSSVYLPGASPSSSSPGGHGGHPHGMGLAVHTPSGSVAQGAPSQGRSSGSQDLLSPSGASYHQRADGGRLSLGSATGSQMQGGGPARSTQPWSGAAQAATGAAGGRGPQTNSHSGSPTYNPGVAGAKDGCDSPVSSDGSQGPVLSGGSNTAAPSGGSQAPAHTGGSTAAAGVAAAGPLVAPAYGQQLRSSDNRGAATSTGSHGNTPYGPFASTPPSPPPSPQLELLQFLSAGVDEVERLAQTAAGGQGAAEAWKGPGAAEAWRGQQQGPAQRAVIEQPGGSLEVAEMMRLWQAQSPAPVSVPEPPLRYEQYGVQRMQPDPVPPGEGLEGMAVENGGAPFGDSPLLRPPDEGEVDEIMQMLDTADDTPVMATLAMGGGMQAGAGAPAYGDAAAVYVQPNSRPYAAQHPAQYVAQHPAQQARAFFPAPAPAPGVHDATWGSAMQEHQQLFHDWATEDLNMDPEMHPEALSGIYDHDHAGAMQHGPDWQMGVAAPGAPTPFYDTVAMQQRQQQQRLRSRTQALVTLNAGVSKKHAASQGQWRMQLSHAVGQAYNEQLPRQQQGDMPHHVTLPPHMQAQQAMQFP